MSYRRKFFGKNKKPTTFALNITSMTDMFTIMLVFLLQTYSTSNVEIKPVEKLMPPSSESDKNPIEGLEISISKEALYISGQKIALLKDLQFNDADLDKNDPQFIPKLFEIAHKREQIKDFDKKGFALLQADREVPYETLKKVFYTLSMAGYPQLKLVTALAANTGGK